MDPTRLRELTQDSFRTVTLPTSTLAELLDTLEECSAIANNIKGLNMNITDEIVEVVAKALDDHEFPGEGWESESSSGFWRSVCRDRARAALEAAAPLIAATVWDEGFEAGATWEQSSPSGIPHDPPLNPYDRVKP